MAIFYLGTCTLYHRVIQSRIFLITVSQILCCVAFPVAPTVWILMWTFWWILAVRKDLIHMHGQSKNWSENEKISGKSWLWDFSFSKCMKNTCYKMYIHIAAYLRWKFGLEYQPVSNSEYDTYEKPAIWLTLFHIKFCPNNPVENPSQSVSLLLILSFYLPQTISY